jgi:hypothetical protein
MSLAVAHRHGFNVFGPDAINAYRPLCNIGGAANSTVTATITTPQFEICKGGMIIENNTLKCVSGLRYTSYSNQTLQYWEVDLATGIETQGSTGSVPNAAWLGSGVVNGTGVSDVPIFVCRAFNTDHGFFTLSNFTSFKFVDDSQVVGIGSGLLRYCYKDGVMWFNTTDGYVKKATAFVAHDSGSMPTIGATSGSLGGCQSIDVDASYCYSLTGTTITVMNKSDLSTVTTLTHPDSSGTANNLIRCDEFGRLLAIGDNGIWRHDGSNSWTQMNSSLGSAAPSSQTNNPAFDNLLMHRNVLYRLVQSPNGNNQPWSLFKSIPPC